MSKTVTFFDTVADLKQLTGLTCSNDLWRAGFDLDDWDWGFVSDNEWTEDWMNDHPSDNHPYYEYWLLNRMDNHCCGYEHVEYNGKHYYILYHS